MEPYPPLDKRQKRNRKRKFVKAMEKYNAGGNFVCWKKNQYATEEIAKEGVTRSYLKFGHMLYPYKCDHCGFWHLTKKLRPVDDSKG